MIKNKKQILIVCRGNILRSPFAKVIVKRRIYRENLQDRFSVISRGIQGTKIDPVPVKFQNITFYKDIFSLAQKSLGKYSIDLSHHISKTIKLADVGNSSIVLAMDDFVFKSLQELFPNHTAKIHKFSEIIGNKKINFNDPEKLDSEQKYEVIFDNIFTTIQNGFSNLIELANTSKKL